MEKNDLKKLILDDVADDDTGLWFIIALAKGDDDEVPEVSVKPVVLEALKELLTEGSVRAGIPIPGGFRAYSGPAEKIMAYIEREWNCLNREVNLTDEIWFARPEVVTAECVVEDKNS